MSDERQDTERRKAEILKATVESAGWKEIVYPWLARERKKALSRVKMADSLRTEDVLKEYLTHIGQVNLIESFLKMLDVTQGVKRKDVEDMED